MRIGTSAVAVWATVCMAGPAMAQNGALSLAQVLSRHASGRRRSSAPGLP
jgi:hypothetical protein